MRIFHSTGLTGAWSLAAVCWTSCLLMGIAGCQTGVSQFGTSGEITLDGAPVEQGSITFFPDAANTSGSTAGAVIHQGKYTVPADKGLTPGLYQVKITWSRKTGKKVEASSPHPPGTMIDEESEAIPAKYNTASTLTADILAHDNTLDFDLKSN
ncbi:MAG: hypothetical protein JWN70_5496 [Planctomycetaceae bacterium]|nr:hypothetical protein [Planctomycetaceae bacterium]